LVGTKKCLYEDKLNYVAYYILSLAIGNSCGLVYLRSEKVIENGTVQIEYYPTNYMIQISGSFERKWIHSFGGTSKELTFAGGSYEETLEQNNEYVLTIFRFSVSMNGQYWVNCHSPSLNMYTNAITVNIPGSCVFLNRNIFYDH
jgi:hypothetical protein